MSNDYDVVIIGAGAGGLAAAVPLAQAGKKVLVLEQHEVAGGWTHSFTLNGYRFSPGVHYIGNLQPGGRLRSIYQGLGVSRDLEFCEINPDGYDHIVVGEERFDIPKGKDNFAARMKERFPHEADGIDGYLNGISELMGGMARLSRVKNLSDAAKLTGTAAKAFKWSTRTAQDLIDHYVSDPMVKAIFSAQAGDHGQPLSDVPAIMHAGITNHYFNGGYFPRGGGFAIPRAFVRALRRAGGELRLNTSVSRILIEDGKAVGVELAGGETIRATNIISNADPEVTFGKLIGRDHLPSRLRKKVDKTQYSTSALSLFFAVDMDLRAAGLDSGNYWFFDHEDVDLLYQQGLTTYALESESPGMMFMTATTLKDPSKKHSGHHTLEAFTFVNYDAFKQWADSKYDERPADYDGLKEELSWKMFRFLEKRVPGISQNVVYWSLGTPLTNEHYINATRGNLYGTAKTLNQLGPFGYGLKTPFDNLMMVGASTMSHGVSGVTGSGLAAAGKILGCRTKELLNQKGPELRIYPSEEPEKWPDDLRQRIERGEKEGEE